MAPRVEEVVVSRFSHKSRETCGTPDVKVPLPLGTPRGDSIAPLTMWPGFWAQSLYTEGRMPITPTPLGTVHLGRGWAIFTEDRMTYPALIALVVLAISFGWSAYLVGERGGGRLWHWAVLATVYVSGAIYLYLV